MMADWLEDIGDRLEKPDVGISRRCIYGFIDGKKSHASGATAKCRLRTV
jgi:hypothetical protein